VTGLGPVAVTNFRPAGPRRPASSLRFPVSSGMPT